MKKSILIFSTAVIAFSLTAYMQTEIEDTAISCATSQNDSQLNISIHYEVGNRYQATISKENLLNATTIADLVPPNATNGFSSFRDVRIVIHNKNEKPSAVGQSEHLTSDQLNLLKTIDYSTNFNIEAFAKKKNYATGKMEEQCFVYYITVIPEKEAAFKDGHDALIEYLEEKISPETVIVSEEGLKPGKVQFTISETGTVSDVQIQSTSGYSSIDKKLVTTIEELSGWTPAQNAKGENVAQQLIFFFGKIGC